MMEIMCLGWRQERKVISTVRYGSGAESEDEEQQSSGKVWAHQQWSGNWRQHVAEHMLYGMSIDWSNADWCRPFMMHLVNATVEIWIVKQTANTHVSYVNSTTQFQFSKSLHTTQLILLHPFRFLYIIPILEYSRHYCIILSFHQQWCY